MAADDCTIMILLSINTSQSTAKLQTCERVVVDPLGIIIIIIIKIIIMILESVHPQCTSYIVYGIVYNTYIFVMCQRWLSEVLTSESWLTGQFC